MRSMRHIIHMRDMRHIIHMRGMKHKKYEGHECIQYTILRHDIALTGNYLLELPVYDCKKSKHNNKFEKKEKLYTIIIKMITNCGFIPK
jgi:hypothetical protein